MTDKQAHKHLISPGFEARIYQILHFQTAENAAGFINGSPAPIVDNLWPVGKLLVSLQRMPDVHFESCSIMPDIAWRDKRLSQANFGGSKNAVKPHVMTPA